MEIAQRMVYGPLLGLTTVLSLSLGTATVQAQHTHAGDFEVELDGSQLEVHPRVMESELEAVNGWSTDEPGFDSQPIFTPGTRIGFNILEPLKIWNGSGFDSLNPATQEVMGISFNFGLPTGTVFRLTSTGFVAGFDIAVNSAGEWHRHLTFTLSGPGGNFTIDPTAGIYLLEMELYSTDTSLTTSEPFWIVFNSGGSAFETQHEDATLWVESNLVPEPTTGLMLAAVGALAMLRRRQR